MLKQICTSSLKKLVKQKNDWSKKRIQVVIKND